MSEDVQKKIFSKNLNQLIEQNQKNQKEVADAIGVSPQTFNTWCRGIALPRMGKVQMLADYFRINKSDLLEEGREEDEYCTNNEIIKRIKDRRVELSLSYQDLADRTKMSKSTLQRYETGAIRNLPLDKLSVLAKGLSTTPAYLMGWEDENSSEKGVKVPVLGEVPAGIPLEAIEDIIDYEEIPQEMAKTGEFFALRIKGESMSPRILDGDVVIVRKQDDAETGDIVIVLVNGSSATCKRLVKNNEGISLISFNPAYTPMFYTKDDVLILPIKILGKVVELRGKF